MKTSILINAASIGADTWSPAFTVESGRKCQLWQKGLAGAEKAELELLAADVDLEDAVAGDWSALKSGGTAIVLDVNTNARLIEAPGTYRVKIASAAGAVKVGIY